MTAAVGDVFADTAYWIALVVRQDQYHERARAWSLKIAGRITTTVPVLLETANALARPAWRAAAVRLLERIEQREAVVIAPLSPTLWRSGLALFQSRPDKAWSLTDCTSFIVMRELGLNDALTSDDHFRQAGFRPLLFEDA